MAADLGKAYVNIIPKAEGISANMESLLGGSEAGAGVQKAGSGLGSKLMTGLKVGAAAAGVAIGKIIKDSFEAGGKLEQSFGGLDTIFGDASAQAKEFAVQAASMGISANTYAEQAVGMGAALKQAFGGDTDAAVKAADMAIRDMADNAAKMGTPIENLQNAYAGFAKGNYTMLDNLKLGYGGTKTEMERLLADAEKFSGVKYDINNLGDVYEAIHVIQGELGLTGVSAEDAKGTLQGTTGAMKASWENLMAAMTTGEGLEAAMANMGESVSSFIDVVVRMGGTIAAQLPTVIKELANKALDNAPAFIASGAELMVKLAVGIVNGIPKVIAKLPEVFQRVKTSFAGYDWGALGKELVSGLVAGLKDMGTAVWNAIKSALSGLGSSIWSWIKEQIRGGAGDGDDDGGDDGGSGATTAFNSARRNGNGAMSALPFTPGRTAGSGGGISLPDLEQLLRGLTVDVDVELTGDAGQIFKVVRTQAIIRTTATGKPALA